MTDTETRRIKKIDRPAPNPYVENMRAQRHGPVEIVKGERAKKELAEMRGNAEKSLTHATPRIVEGYVTLAQLAGERGIQAQLARLWLKNAGVKKPSMGWRWKESSREVTRVRKALELPV